MPKVVSPGTWGGGGGGGGGDASVIDWSGVAAITTASANASGGTATDDVAAFMDIGVVHRIKVEATSNTVLTTIQVYANAGHTILLYEAVGVDCFTAAYEDLVPWHYRDDAIGTTFHYLITNNGANASTYTITVQAVGV
jgi:hypothetical protein